MHHHRCFLTLILATAPSCLALGAAYCEPSDSAYAEMETHTDECGITEFTDACGSKKGVADDELLHEEIGSCAGSSWNHVSGGDVYVPGHPILVGSAACDANLVVKWVPPNENGAPITEYEVTLYEANGPELRSVIQTPAELMQGDGTLRYEETALAPGNYRVMVKATNMFGPGAAGATQVITVAATSKPKMPTLTVWETDGKIVASAIPGGDDICNLPKSYTFDVFRVPTPGSHGEKVRSVTSATSQFEFRTSDSHVRVGNELLVGTSYTFAVTATNSQGAVTTSMSKPIRAMGKPSTPIIAPCKDFGFGCKVTNNCTGGIRFTWPPVARNGVTGGSVRYNVRAYIRGQLRPAKEYQVATEMFEDSSMGWGIGKHVMFSVQAVDTKTTWLSGWSLRTPEVMMPGPPALPMLSLTPGINTVKVSWDSTALPWYEGEQMKVYKLVGNSRDRSEVVNERICILRTCSASPQTKIPSSCKNTLCDSHTFDDISSGWLTSNSGGVTFTVKAEAADHSNCANQKQVMDASGKPAAVHPVTVPDPPTQIMVDSVYGSGAITVSFPASTTYIDAPILSYTVSVFRWDGPGTPGTELYTTTESRNINKEQLSFTYSTNLDYNRDHFVKVKATNVVGTGPLSRMSNTVTVAPSETSAAQNVLDAKNGKIPSAKITFAVTLPGMDAMAFTPEVRQFYTDAVAQAVHVLPEYVEIANVTTVACANPQCSLFQTLEGRRLADFPMAVQLDFQITLPAPDSASFSAAQSDAATTSTLISQQPDLFLDDLTANLQKSDLAVRYPRLMPRSIFVSSATSSEVSPDDLNSDGGSDQMIDGVSDYATVVMIVGGCCAMLGTIFFILAKERVLSAGDKGQGVALPIEGQVLGTPADSSRGGPGTGWKRASLQSTEQQRASRETSFFDEVPTEREVALESVINPALAKGKKTMSRPDVSAGAGASAATRPSGFGKSFGGKKKQDLSRRSGLGARRSQGGRPSDLRVSSGAIGARRSTTKVRKDKSQTGERTSNLDPAVRESSFDVSSGALEAIDFSEDRVHSDSTASTVSLSRTHSADV